MNKFFINLVCAFIINKNKRDNFRKKYKDNFKKKYKEKIRPKKCKSTPLQEIKTELRTLSYLKFYNIDHKNSIIFDFSGGLTDQILFFLYAYKVSKEHTNNKNYKFYFNINNCNEEQGGFRLFSFDIYKYINFEVVKLPKEILKIYNDTKNYSYTYKAMNLDFFDDIHVNEHIIDNVNLIEAPIIIKRRITLEKRVNDNFSWFDHGYNLLAGYKYVDDLKKMLKLIVPMDEANKNKLEKIKNCENAICIHIRRGDVIKHKIKYYAVNKNYVNRSIKEMIKKLIEKDNKIDKFNFFIFSDEIKWAEKNLDFNINRNINVDFVDINDGTKPEFELELMKNCKHYILSGGGFSQLPLFFNTNPDKIVIVPCDGDWN
jgi:hypothetical protein